jgi:hypothetical protein
MLNELDFNWVFKQINDLSFLCLIFLDFKNISIVSFSRNVGLEWTFEHTSLVLVLCNFNFFHTNLVLMPCSLKWNLVMILGPRLIFAYFEVGMNMVLELI